MSDEIIRGRVEADISGYKRGMEEAGKATEEFKQKAETGARGLGTLGDTLLMVASRAPGVAAAVLAAGAATLKLAQQVNEATNDLQDFNKTLILSGHAAGVSAGAMADMAKAIDEANRGITRGDANAVLKELASNGAALTGNLKNMAEAALRFEAAGGGAATEVAKNFASLAKEPLKAVVKLNESMNLLTVDTYKQVKALDAAGDKTGAARVAFELYEKAISERTGELTNNLSNIDWLWMSIRDTAREATNAAIGYFRAATNGEKLQKLRQEMAALQEEIAAGKGVKMTGPNSGMFGQGLAQSRVDVLQEQIRLLERGIQAEEEAAAAKRKSAQAVLTYIANDEKSTKAVRDGTKAIRERRDAIEELLLKIDDRAVLDAEKALKDYNAAQERRLDALAEEAAALDTEIEQYGLTKAQIAETTLARAEEELQIKRGLSGNEAQIALLETEVELRRRIAESARSIESRDAARRAADQAEREWQRITDGVGDALSDAIFKGGADGWALLRRTIESTVIRAVVQPIVSNAIGGTMQSMGFGGGGSSGGGFNSFGSLANTALGPLGGTAGVVSGLSSLAAGTALGSFGAGMASGIASFGSLSSSMATFGAGASAGGSVGAGMMLGTAMPYIAAALAIGQALGAFNGPSYHTGSAVMTGTDDAQTRLGHLQYVPGQTRQGVWGGFTEVDARGGSAFTDPLKTLGKALTDTYEQALAAFGIQAKAAAYTAFGADNNDPSNGLFMLYDQSGRVVARNTTNDAGNHYAKDPKQGLEQFAQDATTLTARAILTKLRETDLEDAIDAIFDSIDPAKASLEQLNAAIAAAQAWMAQADQFRAAISEAFDSPMERLQARFVKLGLAIPETVDAYEALVRAQNLGTQSGRDAVAGLLEAKNLWDQVQADQMQAAEEAARAAEEALAAWTRLRDDLTAFRSDLTTGALAGLSPEAAYRAAQAQFTDTSRLAGLGNQDALAQLEEVSRALLEASRAYNAGTAAYYADRDMVLGAVDSGLALTGRKIAGYADGGLFGGGLRIVGERGPEIEATGPARIWSAQQTQAMLGGGNAEVVRELQAVVRVLSTGLASMDKRLANLERSGDEQARVARLAADRRAA